MLDDDALGLIVVDVGVVFQRSGLRGPHDLHRMRGQALEFIELAFVELESSDTHLKPQGVPREAAPRGESPRSDGSEGFHAGVRWVVPTGGRTCPDIAPSPSGVMPVPGWAVTDVKNPRGCPLPGVFRCEEYRTPRGCWVHSGDRRRCLK